MISKMSKVFGRLASAAIFIGVSTAAQAQLSGDIGFSTVFTPADSSFATTSIGSATSIDYNGDQVQNSALATVNVSTGDFAAEGISVGDSVSVFDFTFNPLPGTGVNPLWSVTGNFTTFSFALTSVSIVLQNANFLILSGTGTVSATESDTVAGTWNFTGNTVGSTGSFNFSAGSSVVTPIPEPEIYAMMAAGLGLMGFVARRRQRNGAVS